MLLVDWSRKLHRNMSKFCTVPSNIWQAKSGHIHASEEETKNGSFLGEDGKEITEELP